MNHDRMFFRVHLLVKCRFNQPQPRKTNTIYIASTTYKYPASLPPLFTSTPYTSFTPSHSAYSLALHEKKSFSSILKPETIDIMSSQSSDYQQAYSNPGKVKYWCDKDKKVKWKSTVMPAGQASTSSAQCCHCGFREVHELLCPFNADSPELEAARQKELNAGKQGVAIPKKKKN